MRSRPNSFFHGTGLIDRFGRALLVQVFFGLIGQTFCRTLCCREGSRSSFSSSNLPGSCRPRCLQALQSSRTAARAVRMAIAMRECVSELGRRHRTRLRDNRFRSGIQIVDPYLSRNVRSWHYSAIKAGRTCPLPRVIQTSTARLMPMHRLPRGL